MYTGIFKKKEEEKLSPQIAFSGTQWSAQKAAS